ncbi:MAG: GNAT family N-acetyltransferase [Phycisphaerales bacterium]|jgi:ribosomal protein S18 acetylase RimI-like enzyme|nr:GNAT family N-acetyltransferase [Phycisphaerales bacterium]
MSDSKAKSKINMKLMDIRSADENDVSTLRELFEKSRLDGHIAENDTGADLDHLMAGYFECKDSGFWVAQYEDVIVGMIGVQRINDNSAEIRRLRVRDAFRRRGIGTLLMKHAITFCREKQFLKIVLDVRIERSPAIAMFDTFGFIHSREREMNGRKLLDFYLDLYTDSMDTSFE